MVKKSDLVLFFLFFCVFSNKMRVHVFKSKRDTLTDFLSCGVFVSLRQTFNFRPILEVNECCEGENLARCYNESL